MPSEFFLSVYLELVYVDFRLPFGVHRLIEPDTTLELFIIDLITHFPWWRGPTSGIRIPCCVLSNPHKNKLPACDLQTWHGVYACTVHTIT